MQRFQRILVTVDSQQEAPLYLQRVTQLAEDNRATLKIVDVVEHLNWPHRLTTPDHQQLEELHVQQRSQQLEALAEPIRARGIAVETGVLRGKSAEEIIREVIRHKHDLVLREAKGVRSLRQGFFSTTAVNLIRYCPCAVWLVKPGHRATYQQILAAVDATPDDEPHAELNKIILELATTACPIEGCRVHVAHAWNTPWMHIGKGHRTPEDLEAWETAMRKEMETSFDELLQGYGMSITSENVHLVPGEPTVAIPKLAADLDVDLIVMGTVARTGVAGLLIGNVAERILDRVECSVLAVKPEAFESPIRVE